MERAALSLAASVVSPIFRMLGAKAAPYFGGDITDEELQHLQNIILPKFRTLLRVAGAVHVDELKPWLKTLQDAAYEAEDVLDMYEYKRLQTEVSSLPNPLKKLKKKAEDFVAPLSLKTELKKSMEKLRQSADETDKLISLYGAISQTPLLWDTTKQRQQQLPTVCSPSSPVFGRDKERESLVNMLISATNKLSSSERRTPNLAIYGLGGAGKTTLAQLVYNDSRVVEHFDTRMWVHVSRKFDAHMVTTEIIEQFTKQGEGSNKLNSLNVLQMKLKNLLKSKTFLLVLDDIWCQDIMEWDQMHIPLNEVGDTSRILVTTRTKEVASRLGIKNVVALDDLESEHCLSIFKHYSFGDANKVIHDPELATVANQIIEKLKKSPLSARMVGSLLRGKSNVADWKYILKKDEMLKDTLDALYLSFDNLAPHLQRCFAYCSLYPKGYCFKQTAVEDLVRLWIAQSFVEAPKEYKMTLEDIGVQYFNELVSNSFFQKETYGDREANYYSVIHDLLHDLAEKVSKDHCFRIEDDSEHIPSSVMHLSISTYVLPLHIIPHIFKLVNLRTFIIHEISMVDFDSIMDARNKVFEKFKKLRVLHVGNRRLSDLNKSIGQLKHLRYLQAYDVGKRLSGSFGRLYHLQFLYLGRCYLIEEVSENLNNLINLRFLHADYEIISKIPLFGKLASLQNIENYNASRNKGYEIGQLNNLQQLRGSLHIGNLENVQNKAEASGASLKEKKLLEELSLAWTYSPERDGRIDEEVIKGLVPTPNLNVLRISGYNGIGFPEEYLNDGRFSIPHFLHLSELSIDYCPKLKQMRSLPTTLKQLEVFRCENLYELSSLPFGLRVVRVRDCPKLMQLSPFPPNLEELNIKKCSGVETLLSNILLFESEDEQHNRRQQEKNNQQQIFLRTLSIESCSVSGKKRLFSDPNKLFTSLTSLYLEELPWLTSLFHPDHKLTSLEDINIKDCENLELFGSSLASSSSLQCLKIYNCPRLVMQYSQPEDGSFSLLSSSLEELKFRNSGDLEMNILARCLIGPTSRRILDVILKLIGRCLIGLTSLTKLTLWKLPWLTSLDHKLTSPEDINIKDGENLELFGSSLASSLQCLNIYNCPRLAVMQQHSQPEDGSFLLPSSLDTLEFHNCGDPEMNLLGRCLLGLNSLTRLKIGGYSHARSLPDLASPALITYLRISDCPELTSTWNLQPFSSLKRLRVIRCPKLIIGVGRRLPPLHKYLAIDHLSLLTALLPQREYLNSLIELSVESCTQGIAFTEEQEELFQHLNSLIYLHMRDCPNLTSLPVNMVKLSSLRELSVERCPKIELLPNLPASLKTLLIEECHPQLEVNYEKDGPLRHKLHHIRYVSIY